MVMERSGSVTMRARWPAAYPWSLASNRKRIRSACGAADVSFVMLALPLGVSGRAPSLCSPYPSWTRVVGECDVVQTARWVDQPGGDASVFPASRGVGETPDDRTADQLPQGP